VERVPDVEFYLVVVVMGIVGVVDVNREIVTRIEVVSPRQNLVIVSHQGRIGRLDENEAEGRGVARIEILLNAWPLLLDGYPCPAVRCEARLARIGFVIGQRRIHQAHIHIGAWREVREVEAIN
jgi:hypothetical protein